MKTRNTAEMIARSQEDAHNYRGVEALAFYAFESNSKYYAIGVYNVRGQLTARMESSTFTIRVAETPRDLYLHTLGEDNQARYIHSHFSDLPPVLASLIERAAAA